MNKFRFYVPGHDPRPMKAPPKGPFWCTGHSETHCIVVAYAPDLETLINNDHWPDAEYIEEFGPHPIVFTDRFKKPDWWEEQSK